MLLEDTAKSEAALTSFSMSVSFWSPASFAARHWVLFPTSSTIDLHAAWYTQTLPPRFVPKFKSGVKQESILPHEDKSALWCVRKCSF